MLYDSEANQNSCALYSWRKETQWSITVLAGKELSWNKMYAFGLRKDGSSFFFFFLSEGRLQKYDVKLQVLIFITIKLSEKVLQSSKVLFFIPFTYVVFHFHA